MTAVLIQYPRLHFTSNDRVRGLPSESYDTEANGSICKYVRVRQHGCTRPIIQTGSLPLASWSICICYDDKGTASRCRCLRCHRRTCCWVGEVALFVSERNFSRECRVLSPWLQFYVVTINDLISFGSVRTVTPGGGATTVGLGAVPARDPGPWCMRQSLEVKIYLPVRSFTPPPAFSTDSSTFRWSGSDGRGYSSLKRFRI